MGATKKENTLWSPYGVLSLSSGDPLFRQGEDYWRGKVWGNMNYLAISILGRHAQLVNAAGRGNAEEARLMHLSLRDGFVSTVLAALKKQRYLFENFDPATG